MPREPPVTSATGRRFASAMRSISCLARRSPGRDSTHESALYWRIPPSRDSCSCAETLTRDAVLLATDDEKRPDVNRRDEQRQEEDAHAEQSSADWTEPAQQQADNRREHLKPPTDQRDDGNRQRRTHLGP